MALLQLLCDGERLSKPPKMKCEFISTHTKRHPFRANGNEFADSALSNAAATFRQYLSPIVSKLSTQEI